MIKPYSKTNTIINTKSKNLKMIRIKILDRIYHSIRFESE